MMVYCDPSKSYGRSKFGQYDNEKTHVPLWCLTVQNFRVGTNPQMSKRRLLLVNIVKIELN